MIDLKTQYHHLKESIDNRIQTVLNHGQFILGPEVFELEEHLAEYVGVKHAITCANGTDALQLCLMALGIKPGDAVFCPTFTFVATAEAISLVGAKPVFVDSDLSTYNICTIDLEKKISSILSKNQLVPKAIIAVDLFGLPANYPELQKVADKYSLNLIEDAAQSFGGVIDSHYAGSFGDLATTSFFPAKPLGCYGDGGAVFTDNDEYAHSIKSLRVHGKGKDKYDNIRIGMNSRLDTIQAAILLEKLKVFPQELKNRNIVAEVYTSRLKDKYLTPHTPDGYKSSWAQYTLQDANRDEVMSKLESHNIPSMVYYKNCLHQQPVFIDMKLQGGNFHIAKQLTKQVFSLPIHPYISSSQQDNITQLLIDL